MKRKDRQISATEKKINNSEASKQRDIASFRVRFRFRVQKKLNINDTEYRV
jgi:hypothetical protein